MSSPAADRDASPPRLLILEEEEPADVFVVLGLTEGFARVRSAFLFEVGEELRVRIEVDGTTRDAVARVRTHVGPEDARITELELGPAR